mmetsp:Transcript_16193/g.54613  ORF Transcript_16193/g.54613 Transcript_16193/m.54613 type:complete len:278 (+) Transcript_16193:863-1696(+)
MAQRPRFGRKVAVEGPAVRAVPLWRVRRRRAFGQRHREDGPLRLAVSRGLARRGDEGGHSGLGGVQRKRESVLRGPLCRRVPRGRRRRHRHAASRSGEDVALPRRRRRGRSSRRGRRPQDPGFRSGVFYFCSLLFGAGNLSRPRRARKLRRFTVELVGCPLLRLRLCLRRDATAASVFGSAGALEQDCASRRDVPALHGPREEARLFAVDDELGDVDPRLAVFAGLEARRDSCFGNRVHDRASHHLWRDHVHRLHGLRLCGVHRVRLERPALPHSAE